MSDTAPRCSDASERSDWIFERDFALRFYEAVGSPFAVGAATRLLAVESSGFDSIPADPRNYREPRHFAEDYQVAELLRKSKNIPGTTADTRAAKALVKFLDAEAHNAKSNDRLWGEELPPWFGVFSDHVTRILGPLSDTRLERIAELGKFGPGANVGVRSDGLVPSIKYEAKPVGTAPVIDLLPGLMPACIYDYWTQQGSKVGVVRGNSHFTVPKDWEIDRCAAKEPLWNSFLQAGIGRSMEDSLLDIGVDLHDQRLNQNLAEMAWEWNLATLDLSSASDLMCRVLVLLALTYNGDEEGRRWFHLLHKARSPEMRIDGDWRQLEMFSSMGNGFTFPLETILFSAVIRTCVPARDWCVCTAYGDDMIVPQQYAPQVVECLEYLGFKINSKKSCLAGTFFESCGTDWFQGQNVRPFYLHKEPGSGIPYALQAANSLRAWCIRVYGSLPAKFAALWRWCKARVPQVWRYPVPPELGDAGLHVGISEALKTPFVSPCDDERQFRHPARLPDYNGWEGYVCKHVRLAPVNLDRKRWGVVACGLRNIGNNEAPSRGLEPLRGLFGKPRTETGVVLWKDDFLWGRVIETPLR